MKNFVFWVCIVFFSIVADTYSALGQNYLTLSALENSWVGIHHESNSPDIQYRIDGGPWLVITEDMPVFVEKGSRIYFRGRNPGGFSHSVNNYTSIVISGNMNASGNIMSLVDNTGQSLVIPCGYCFTHLFENSTGLISPPELQPVVLMRGCYSLMFAGCSRMTHSPRLHVQNMAAECYESMFLGCSSIRRIEVRFSQWSSFFDPMYGVDFYSTMSWVNGVGADGIFVCPQGLPAYFGEDFIPEGWQIQRR